MIACLQSSILFSVSGVRLSFLSLQMEQFENSSAFTDGQKMFKIYSLSGLLENKNDKKMQFRSVYVSVLNNKKLKISNSY